MNSHQSLYALCLAVTILACGCHHNEIVQDGFIRTVIKRIEFSLDYRFWGGRQRQEALLLQKRENLLHRYDYPEENNGWNKVGSIPVYGDSTTGTIFDPQVILHNGHFIMTASERNSGSIIFLISDDGIQWTRKGTLLSPNKGAWEGVVNRSCLRVINGMWHLWYTGQNGGSSYIGHLTSPSPDTFVRPQNNMPIISPTLEDEGVAIMNPCVLWDEQMKKYRMWYAAGELYEPDVIMYAESVDGIEWTKHPMPVLTKYSLHEWEQYKIGGCDVTIQPDGTYVMYYIGYQNVDVARICYAVSNDGICWTRPTDNYCISPSPNAWDADAVYKPTFIEKDDVQYLWYNGRNRDDEYIGVAIRRLCQR